MNLLSKRKKCHKIGHYIFMIFSHRYLCTFCNSKSTMVSRCEEMQGKNCRQELRAFLLGKYPSVNIHPVRYAQTWFFQVLTHFLVSYLSECQHSPCNLLYDTHCKIHTNSVMILSFNPIVTFQVLTSIQ